MMVETVLRAAELCAALYRPGAAADPNFAVYDEGNDDGICWAIAHDADADIVILRGSVTPEDWFDDIQARPYLSRRMGYVHRGFYLGMDNAWTDIRKGLRGKPITVTGHSLGAARSALLTGMMLCDGITPTARVAFGEPKPGFAELATLIAGVAQRSYRNGVNEAHDVVTDLPFTLPRLGLDYVHPKLLTLLPAQPDPNDNSGIFCYHHMDLYLKSLTAAFAGIGDKQC